MTTVLYWYTVLAWRSGNTLDLINVVTLRWARLVSQSVTVFGRVNHQGTQVYSARANPPWVGRSEYWLWLWREETSSPA